MTNGAVPMKQLHRCCWGAAACRVGWRKAFFAGALMTVVGAMLQMFTLPFPLGAWFVSHPEFASSSDQLLTSFALSESLIKSGTPGIIVDSPVESLIPVVSSAEPAPEKGSSKSRRRKVVKEASKSNDMHPPPQPPPPARRTIPYKLQKFIWSLKPDEALQYARKEMDQASQVIDDDDPELCAPLFLNISAFKRSYELMEMILKVYIYPDGTRPIFHTPHLRGIYASEGWFMRLMEGNRQFVTRDPEKAHLFYLPYSSRQLQVALYVPDSHNMKPLSIFLRNYVNKIATKYPYWNRSHGSDHFLAACHDWGPYTVTEHKELLLNTIKALCNADISERIFVPGKDVSLPETTIRTPKKPLRNVGGRRVSQRPILAFFAGNMHGRVRPTLLEHWLNKDEDMKIYGPLPGRIARKMSYIQHMKSSKYCLCPMGYEVNSPRIIEAIYYECVPVIIADNFALPLGDVLDWSSFSVVVAEKDIPRLKDILLAISFRRYLAMQINVKMVQKHFLWNPRPVRFDLFHMILHSIWFNRLNQIQIPTT